MNREMFEVKTCKDEKLIEISGKEQLREAWWGEATTAREKKKYNKKGRLDDGGELGKTTQSDNSN